MEVDNPEYLIHEIFSSNFWKGHALGRPILGTKQTIRSFDRDKIEKYYRQFLHAVEHPDHGGGESEAQRNWCKLAEEQFADLKPRHDSLQAKPSRSRTRRWCSATRIAGAGAPVSRRAVDSDAA